MRVSAPWNLPVSRVMIDGTPIDVIVDTGAESVLVTPETKAALGLPEAPGRLSIVRGIAGETEHSNVSIDTLDLGGASVRHLNVPVGSLPVADVDDVPLGGVIGSDVLSRFDVDFDAPGGVLRLYRSAECAGQGLSGGRPASAIQANRSERGRLFLPVRVDGHLLLAVLDTGFSYTTITARAAVRLGITQDALAADRPAGVTRGVDLNDRPNRWHEFAEIRIGREILRHRPVIISDLPTSDVDMLIGMDFVGQRRLFLAYAAATVFVERPQAVAVSVSP